jgi:putative ABC transport system permease protein
MRTVLAWFTDAALADSILGDLEEVRRRRGILWFWSAVSGVAGYAAWTRLTELVSSGGGMQRLGGDARHAVRVLRRRPGFALITIFLLALGIGANAAVFSVVHAVLLRPLPYAEPDRLVHVWGRLDTYPGNRHSILTGNHAAAIKAKAATLESFALVRSWQTGLETQVDLATPDGAERLRGAGVTPNFFELLGARATRGRTFSSADTDAPLVVISDGLWRRRFGADPAIAGRTAMLTAGRAKRATSPYTIVGVLAPDFRFSYPRDTEIYLLMPWATVRPIGAVEFQSVARLKPRVTVHQAQAELNSIAKDEVRASYRRIGAAPEAEIQKAGMLVEPDADHLQAETRPGVMLLAAVAGLVLLIACVNLGLLLLSRAVDRRGELGLRAALGAGAGRIVAQLTMESAVLSLAGGLAGLATVAVAMPAIRALMPPIVPRVDQIGVDPMVLAFAGALMLITTAVCGVGPAWIVLRRDLLDEVRRAPASSTGDRAILLSRRLIVSVQVAVVVLLLVGSSLLLRSFWRLQQVDLGFTTGDVVTMEMRLLGAKFREPGRIASFQEDLLARVRAVPGVARAGLTTAVPMRGVDFVWSVGSKGGPNRAGNMRSVDPEYFGVMQLGLKAGRFLDSRDTATSERVAVVSESYGRLHFGSASPLGRQLSLDPDARIVGVVGDVRYADVTRDPYPAFYLPNVQHPVELICLVVEPQPGALAAVVSGLRAAVQAADPDQPIEGLTTIRQLVSQSTADRRFYAVTTGAFASVALLLAIAGIFGVVSRTVSERKRELAIRIALGAEPRRLLRLVYGYGLLPAAAGTAVGLAAAYAGSRLLRGFLFQIGPTDTLTFAGAATMVLAVTTLACYLPARRTLRVQPMAVLKSD